MNRTDRLYAIVEELRAVAPAHRSTTWLADRFEVSTRTVERDLSALQQAGLPIYATPGRRGGYAIDPDMTLPPVNFTPAEAVAVAVALARPTATPFPQAARTALQKMLATMRAGDAEAARKLGARIRFLSRSEEGWTPPPPVPAAIEEALVRHRVLQLTYQDAKGDVTDREVEPVSFFTWGRIWYLVGWCRLRNDARSFRVERIRDAVVTNEPAPERAYEEVAPRIPDLVAKPALAE